MARREVVGLASRSYAKPVSCLGFLGRCKIQIESRRVQRDAMMIEALNTIVEMLFLRWFWNYFNKFCMDVNRWKYSAVTEFTLWLT